MGSLDVIVVGGGHNGLVAAAYLARAGLRVRVLERTAALGGAAQSIQAFPGVDARLSRYSYLVSLLPDHVRRDLGLRIELRSRPFGSCTPVVRDGDHGALLIEREPGRRTAESFRALTGAEAEHSAWQSFHAGCERLARAVFPTLTAPLPTEAEVRDRLGDDQLWDALVRRPLGEVLEATFTDDAVRGIVLTDALIGTFTHAHDASLRQNRCFLYHVIGGQTGEWRVPVGGMGAVTAELARVSRAAGAELVTCAEVVAVDGDDDGATVRVRHAGRGAEETLGARHVLAGVAPAALARLTGDGGDSAAGAPGSHDPVEGSSAKVNMVLTRLPALRAAGVDPADAFAGTFHVDEGYANSEAAYRAAARGELPQRPPFEVYCHSLTDPGVAGAGLHTLTLFAVHLPARLFRGDNEGMRAEVTRRCLASLNRHLAEPIEDCLARDAEGRPCLETRTPLDLESELRLPGGHIFHRDLQWPWADDGDRAGSWGVETARDSVVLCGAGARRGGGVSGVAGHNAAMAVLGARS
jgi:phytoene dehydrogenase-like protein